MNTENKTEQQERKTKRTKAAITQKTCECITHYKQGTMKTCEKKGTNTHANKHTISYIINYTNEHTNSQPNKNTQPYNQTNKH